MSHRTTITAALLAATAVAAPAAYCAASATPAHSAVLTIRHQARGCHTWSFDGKTWAAAQSISLARGATLKVVDQDVMPHLLLQVTGPRVAIAAPTMSKMGAAAAIRFTRAGVYSFRTKGGADYMKGVKTVGPDNKLTLRVTVR